MNICLEKEAPWCCYKAAARCPSPVPCGQTCLVAVERCSRFVLLTSACLWILTFWWQFPDADSDSASEKQNKLVSRNTIICFHLNKSVECSHCQGLNFIIFRGKSLFCLFIFWFFSQNIWQKFLFFCFPKETALFLYKPPMVMQKVHIHVLVKMHDFLIRYGALWV